MRLSLGLLLIGILALSCLSTSIFSQQNQALAQQYIQTIKYRNLVIDLGNGLKTNAQLTLPALGHGPYPGVLLIPGTGAVDKNETLGFVHKNGPKPPTPFWQIAQYLSERGFAVLRYDKRGIGANHTILDSNVWGNATFNDLKRDVQKALAVLINQAEVDPNKITILGHSEGTIITPRVAIDNTTKVKNIVLMGAVAQNLSDISYFQGVSLPLLYAEKVLDHNHDGMLSISEANKNPVFSSMVGNLTLLLETSNGTKHQLNPKYNTNNDAYISINNELKPKLIAQGKSLSAVTPGKKCTSTCPTWVRSHALEPTLSIIGNVSPKTSILILRGENDTQTPVQQAFLLQQALIDKRHPDHTLITYPNLGHVFYPSSEWTTALGPIQQNVLADLYSWLEAHSGLSRSFASTTASTMGTNTSSVSTITTSALSASSKR
jgi:alpha-beta hydrolase superfamily lysophospholipase